MYNVKRGIYGGLGVYREEVVVEVCRSVLGIRTMHNWKPHRLPATNVDRVVREVHVRIMLTSDTASRLVTRHLVMDATLAWYSGVMSRWTDSNG